MWAYWTRPKERPFENGCVHGREDQVAWHARRSAKRESVLDDRRDLYMGNDFLHQVIDNTAWARQFPFYALS